MAKQYQQQPRGRRRQPLSYDSRKAGGINATDFGDIAQTFTEGQKYIREVAAKTDKNIQDNIDSVIENTDYEFIGQADFDSASMDTMNKIRDDLYNERAKIGVNGYSIHDFNRVYNKSMSSAKTYGGFQKFIETEMKAISEDETLSGIVQEGLINELGAAFSKDGKYRMDVNAGDLYMTSYTEDEDGNVIKTPTDMKRLLINGQDRINTFDVMGSVGDVQKLYMDRVKDPSLPEFLDLEGNPGLWARQITTETHGPKFDKFLTAHVKNFSQSDDAIAYAYDTMGMKLGRDISQRNGKFILSDEQRKSIGDNYRLAIEGQMGIKKTAKGRYIPDPRKSSSSGKAPSVNTINKVMPLTYMADGPAKQNNKASYVARITNLRNGTVRSEINSQADDTKINTELLSSFITKVPKNSTPSQKDAIDIKNKDSRYKLATQYPELFNFFPNGAVKEVKGENLKMSSIGISADLQLADLKELAVNSETGFAFENMTGLQLIEKKTPAKGIDGVMGTDYFFRFSGSTVESESIKATQSNVTGMQNGDKKINFGESTGRKLYREENSTNLSDQQLNKVVSVFKKANRAFESRYNQAVQSAAMDKNRDVTDVIEKRRILAEVIKSLENNPIIQ